MERRRGSNPRRPAWEDDCKWETKNIAFSGTSFWRLRIPRFHSVLSSGRKRSTNGARRIRRWSPRALEGFFAWVGIWLPRESDFWISFCLVGFYPILPRYHRCM